MNKPLLTLMVGSLAAAGFAVAGLWLVGLVQAFARRDQEAPAAAAGTGRAALGALAGVALGVVAGCTGLLGVVETTGGRVDLPELFLLALLAIPVGLIACPALVLWGTVAAWRVAERDPADGASPAFFAPPSPDPAGAPDGLDALDAHFQPPPVPGRDGEPTA